MEDRLVVLLDVMTDELQVDFSCECKCCKRIMCWSYFY